jgi:glycosyltransferase involved in cell wall biosynthesis
MAKVSVVIPSYNHAQFISMAINSVLGQTEPDFELIIVDDGSTDDSLDIISGFIDPRVTILTQTNQGAHAAINRGLQEASSHYLAILNSDDVYHPQRLEKTIHTLEANSGLGMVGSYIEIIDDQNKPLGVKHGFKDCSPWPLEKSERSFREGSDLKATLLTENYWSTTSNFVFSRGTFERVGDFRPLRYAHDWDFALRVARETNLAMLPEPLMSYRVHERNTIREDQASMIFEICWCLAVHLPVAVEDEQFYREYSRSHRIDQLLNSIYTFGCDRVLSVLLLYKIHEKPDEAINLLEPGNEIREEFLRFIYSKIGNTVGENGSSLSQDSHQSQSTPDSVGGKMERKILWIRRYLNFNRD